MEIYFPMTANILTVGHIKCLEELTKQGWVTIGLLTAEALKGYKSEAMPYKDRYYILETVGIAIGKVAIVPQTSLDPGPNLKKYKMEAIASGDGWEKEELAAIKKCGVKKIDLRLRGEKQKKYSAKEVIRRLTK